MDYKKLITELQQKNDAYRFFDEERLNLLKIGIDLQIANRNLDDLKGFDSNIADAQMIVFLAKDNFDKMFCKYELASIEMENMRMNIGTLLLYVQDLEKEIVKLNSTL
jgi:hypothetical protein